MKFIDQVPRFVLKMSILVVVPLMMMSPFSTKPVLVLNFNFGLAGSKPLLVGIGESTVFPHTLLDVSPAHKTR